MPNETVEICTFVMCVSGFEDQNAWQPFSRSTMLRNNYSLALSFDKKDCFEENREWYMVVKMIFHPYLLLSLVILPCL